MLADVYISLLEYMDCALDDIRAELRLIGMS